jgi:hypothetical protein
MAYTSDKKPGALTQATVLGNTDNVVVEQSGDVKRATLSQVEAKIFDSKTATSTPTGTEVTVIRLTDGNLRQVALSNIVPAGNITNAKVSDTAAIADTKLATISTAGKVLNSATTATSANTNNAIVARDGSGNFSAGTITATLAGSATGNAATATNLSSNRTFALTGNVTGSTNSNLSSGVSIATTIPNGTVTSAMISPGTIVNADISASAAIADTKLATINTAGKVTNNAVQAVSTNTANRIVTRDASGNFAAGTVTAALTGNVTGNASTATTLATGRTIALTGDVTGTTGTFNGSANVSAATTIANNAVTTAKIADLAVTSAKIAANAVTSSELANSAVATANIANLAVTTAKIADSNVTTAKIADLAVTAAKIASNSVTSSELANSAVATANIANLAVTTAKIADGNVTNVKLASGIDASKLTTGTLPSARIASGAIALSQLSLGSNFPIQVVQAVKSDTQEVSGSGNVWEDITGLSLTLTRRIASNAGSVRVQAVIHNSTNNSTYGVLFRVVRGSTAIGLAASAGSRIQATTVSHFPNTSVGMTSSVIDFVDNSPGSTSTVTYKIQARTWSTVKGWINRSNTDSDADNYARAISTLTLTELTP